MNKAKLRQLFLEKRQNLPRSEYWHLTEQLMLHIPEFDWKTCKRVHIFLPISKHKEVDTFSIIQYFKEHQPHLELSVPRTDFANLTMQSISYDHEYTILQRNKMEIPEPVYGKVMASELIDLVFIPLLAYDRLGNRAGYGKGFYDRFLTTCRPDVKKVGLSYFDPVNEISDLNSHDVKLDLCICPKKIWDFSSSSDTVEL